MTLFTAGKDKKTKNQVVLQMDLVGNHKTEVSSSSI